MAGGRPSAYTPDLGTKIVGLMHEGLSLTAAAAEMNVCRDTVYEWASKYPEFSDAKRLGQGKRQAFLERRLLSAEQGPVVTSTIFALKNCNPESGDWRDQQNHTLAGPDGVGPVKTETTIDMMDAARKLAFVLAAGLAAKKAE